MNPESLIEDWERLIASGKVELVPDELHKNQRAHLYAQGQRIAFLALYTVSKCQLNIEGVGTAPITLKDFRYCMKAFKRERNRLRLEDKAKKGDIALSILNNKPKEVVSMVNNPVV